MTHPPDTNSGEASRMGDNPIDHSKQASLSDRQLAVYKALQDAGRAGPACAVMYRSAVQVIGSEITEREVLASHALRELLDKLPGVVGVKVDRGSFGYRSRVGSLRADWDQAIQNSRNTTDGITWSGYIDSALQRFLKYTRTFFNDERGARVPGAEGARTFIRTTDPLASELPRSVEADRLEIWEKCRSYFQAVSHHDPQKNISDILEYVFLLEDFLLDQLRPRTTSDQATILSIINEAESND